MPNPQQLRYKLRFLESYILRNRGRGHTTAIMDGLRRKPDVVYMGRKEIEAKHDAIAKDASHIEKVIGWEDFKPHQLRGRTAPLIIDSGALLSIFDRVVEVIDHYENRLRQNMKDMDELLERMDEIEEIVSQLEKVTGVENHEQESLPEN